MGHFIIPLAALTAFLPFASGALSLVLGIIIALTVGNHYSTQTKKLAPLVLGISIVGLGAGMNLAVIFKAGVEGIALTIVGIIATMALGWLLGRMMGVPRETSLLISAGTAICGGSAIAATSAAINAKNENTSIALGIVFLLNAVALLTFPELGRWMGLSENQFGLWSALAIHDTSSVVGAAMKYGPRALEVATTVKLTRALWIAPLVIVIQYFYSRKSGTASKRARIPWFIAGFVIAAAFVTWIPVLQGPGLYIATASKSFLILALFFIGANLSRTALRQVGLKPLAQGILLWIAVAWGSLFLL